MDTNTAIPTGRAEPTQGASMNFFQRLAAIYFEPRRTFQDIKLKGAWLGMFLLVTAVTLAATYVATTRVDRETYMRKTFEKNPLTKNMSEEQIQKILSQPRSPVQEYLGFAMVPFVILLIYAALAGLFMLVFVLMGAPLTYKKSLAVTIWAMAPPAILVTILSIVFMLVKDPDGLDLVNFANNVVSNPGPLVDEKSHPLLHTLLSSIDVFSFWTIYLLALGFSTIAEPSLRFGKAATVVVVLWAVYVVGKIGFFAIFS